MIVGRERELERIEDLLGQAQTGRGSVAVVEGPAGIGKTALLAEAARRADSLGFCALRGGGSRLERAYAFGIVRQLFTAALRARPGSPDLFDGAARLAAAPLGLASAEEVRAEGSVDMSAAMHGLLDQRPAAANESGLPARTSAHDGANVPQRRLFDASRLIDRRVEPIRAGRHELD
ncbi:MAG: ATP-binding protein [Solirubrobacterales bacterium]|nr:ATP-binding protein [Solirubrobacterales bacterium]MBV9808370.1 ATP-binding protein [Solirubrobacterales bacterium]